MAAGDCTKVVRKVGGNGSPAGMECPAGIGKVLFADFLDLASRRGVRASDQLVGEGLRSVYELPGGDFEHVTDGE